MIETMQPPAYHLRSHALESATAGSKPIQQESPPKTKQDENNQIAQSESNSVGTAALETESQKEDENSSPSEPSEPNSLSVDGEAVESETPTRKSNKITNNEKSQEKDVPSCPKCNQTFESPSHLTEHIKTHSTDQTTCPICGKVLNSSNSRDRHLLTHSGEKPYACKICGVKFTTNGNMNRHFKNHDAKKKQKGTVTNETEDDDSKKEGNITKEEEVPPQTKESKCANETPEQDRNEEMCSQKDYFESLGLCRKPSVPQSNTNQELALKADKLENVGKLLGKRKISATSDTGMIDEIPGPSTEAGGNLRRKKSKENNEVESSKEINSSSTKSRSDSLPGTEQTDVHDLAGITDIISNVQPKTVAENQILADTTPAGNRSTKRNTKQTYACESCNYTAKDKSSLKKHSKTHKRNGIFQCSICKYNFTNKANGHRHVRERHGILDLSLVSKRIVFIKEESDSADEKSFNCKYCSATFDNEQSLQHHLRSNDCPMKPYFCTICETGFSTKNNCFRHIGKQHPGLFPSEMKQEDKNKIKELNKRKTFRFGTYISPPQDEDKTSKEIAAAEGLCRLSGDRQDDISVEEAIYTAKQLPDTSCTELVNVESPTIDVERDLTETDSADPVGTDHLVTTRTVSPMIAERATRLSLLLTKKSSESLEDKPLDLSLNPLDLSVKTFKEADSTNLQESSFEKAHVSENEKIISGSKAHSKSPHNFGKNDNLKQQKIVPSKKSTKIFKCKHCEKPFSNNSNLQRHLANLHKTPPTPQFEPSIPIRKDLLRENSINSSVKHSGCHQVKISRSSPMVHSKFIGLYDRGTGSDTENDLASIPSIQSTVNQGIHIAHPCTSTVYSVISHVNRKRLYSDAQSSDFSLTAWNQRKKLLRNGPPSPTESACSPVSIPQRVINDEGSIGENPTTNSGNSTPTHALLKSTHDQSFNVRIAESAEPSKDTDLICRYCSSQFSSKEHVRSHIKELHYLEHNNTQEVPDEKIRWKKERFSKLRQ